MTNYKLVPVELTPEMVKVDPYGLGYGRLQAIWASMLAVAPEQQVEQEPVAYISHTSEGDILGWERQFDAPSHTPLSATPQTSFQLPDFATDPDDSDEVASLWEHGFKRGWNSCLKVVAEAMQSAAQQPAPDVTRLAEALEELVDLMEDTRQGEYVPDSFTTQPARIVLAAYRKGSDVCHRG